jgi:hypothetical protein
VLRSTHDYPCMCAFEPLSPPAVQCTLIRVNGVTVPKLVCFPYLDHSSACRLSLSRSLALSESLALCLDQALSLSLWRFPSSVRTASAESLCYLPREQRQTSWGNHCSHLCSWHRAGSCARLFQSHAHDLLRSCRRGDTVTPPRRGPLPLEQLSGARGLLVLRGIPSCTSAAAVPKGRRLRQLTKPPARLEAAVAWRHVGSSAARPGGQLVGGPVHGDGRGPSSGPAVAVRLCTQLAKIAIQLHGRHSQGPPSASGAASSAGVAVGAVAKHGTWPLLPESLRCAPLPSAEGAMRVPAVDPSPTLDLAVGRQTSQLPYAPDCH